MKKKFTVQNITLCALMTALMAIFSWISLPLPNGVPITLQAFGIAVIGYTIGPLYGLVSIVAWILLGAVGVPVFASFRSGVSVLVGMTGGFIWGYPAMVVMCGLGKKRPLWLGIICGLVGLVIINITGALQYSLLTYNTYWQSVLLVCVPYFLKDVICVVLVAVLSRGWNKTLSKVLNRQI